MKRLYQATRRVADTERCELCAQSILARHDHLYEVRVRAVRCVCEPCAVIIPTAEASPFVRVPRRFDAVDVDPARWLPALGVPVGVAAVIRRGAGAVAGFPGPVGLVETPIDDDLWRALAAEVPAAAALVPDVEALVLSSLRGGGGGGAWVTGIDVVFKMIAELRTSWRGLTGGPEAPAAIARVLTTLAAGASRA